MQRRTFIKSALTATGLAASGVSTKAISSQKKSVIIIGGGLSGLYAGTLLRDYGFNVTLLEGGHRLGGRVHTAYDIETRPEYGASQIGRSYARTISLCRRFNLRLIPEHRDLLPMASHIQNEWVNAENWAESPVNRMVGQERDIAPALTGSRLLQNLNPLKELTDWLDPKFSDYDVSVYDLLTKSGASESALRLADASSDIRNASALSLFQEKTRGLFDARFGGADISKLDRPYGFDNQKQEDQELALISNIEGGCSRLPEAMADYLGDAVHTNKIVTHIDLLNLKSKVQCLDGSVYQADFVVSAIPFSTLRNVAIYPHLKGPQSLAVRQLGYANTTRAYGIIEEPYWEQDGIDPSFFTPDGVHMLWAFKMRPDEKYHRFMVVFTEPGASRIDQLPKNKAMAFIRDEIARIRPSTKHRLRFLTMYSWQNDKLIRGCRHMFRPGQVNAFAKEMILPHEKLHFAGEHTRRYDFGMEAALESGERVSAEILMRS